jgi:PAS domain S-box-containing protein
MQIDDQKIPAELRAESGPILYVLGSDGNLRWISASVRTLCGLEPVDVIGAPLSRFLELGNERQDAAGSHTSIGKLKLPGGSRRSVMVVETRGGGMPGFGAIAPLGEGIEGPALAALMGQVMLWRLDLRTLRGRAFGRLAETVGYNYGEISDLGWMDLVHPEDVAMYQMQLEDVVRGQRREIDVETRVRRKDGRWLWTLSRGEVSARDETGFPVEMSGFSLDISRQKQVEIELQAHRALLRRSLRLARVAAWAYDAQAQRQIWTDEASELLAVPPGYVPDNLLGLELFDGESQVRVNKAVTRALNEGIGFDQELLRITPQGRVLWVRAVANPEFEDGVMVRLSGLFQDITRQRRMEQAVRDSERLLKQLTAGLPDAIFQLRRAPEGHFHLDFLSDGIRRMLAIPATGALPDFQALLSALEPDSRANFVQSLERSANQRELVTQELRAAGHSGPNRILMGRAQPEPQLDGSCLYFGFLSDVTEQRQQEMALRDAEQTQQRLTRLEAVGQLAGGIAHDFNNYLTSIVMSLSLLEAQPELSHDAIQLVREALSATSSAQALTRQLLTFSRGAAPVKQIVDTEALVREAVTFTLRGSAVHCTVQALEPAWPIEVDAGQIQQILQNLVLNASQAMHGQGQLLLKLENFRAGSADVAGLPPGPSVRISVIDKGEGVPEVIREKLFQPYVTSKEYGSGLGLASAFSIARRHDGMITYEANPGGGAIFSVWLPATSRQQDSDLGLVMATGAGKILVMDDNEGILKMLRRALNHLGFEAITAHDGREALAQLDAARASGVPLRAVILDQTIPGGIGGAEALKMLRARDPKIVAIATSGYSEGETMAHFEDFGFAGVLRKPFRIQDLAKVLAEVLR